MHICVYNTRLYGWENLKLRAHGNLKSALPAHIVDEYERGIHQEIQVNSFVSGGQTISMLAHGSDNTQPT